MDASALGSVTETQWPIQGNLHWYFLFSLLAAVSIFLAIAGILYWLCDYEALFIRYQVWVVRALCVFHFSSLYALCWHYNTQVVLSNLYRGLLTTFICANGLFVDVHTAFRWIYFGGNLLLLVAPVGYLGDIHSIIFQAAALDCQLYGRCTERDPNWLLKMSLARQFFAITIEILGLIFCGYLFIGLGLFTSAQLPRDVGIPEHIRLLAGALLQRKLLEARNPLVFQRNKIKVLFNPDDVNEIFWDKSMNSTLGDKLVVQRKSYPISSNPSLSPTAPQSLPTAEEKRLLGRTNTARLGLARTITVIDRISSRFPLIKRSPTKSDLPARNKSNDYFTRAAISPMGTMEELSAAGSDSDRSNAAVELVNKNRKHVMEEERSPLMMRINTEEHKYGEGTEEHKEPLSVKKIGSYYSRGSRD